MCQVKCPDPSSTAILNAFEENKHTPCTQLLLFDEEKNALAANSYVTVSCPSEAHSSNTRRALAKSILQQASQACGLFITHLLACMRLSY